MKRLTINLLLAAALPLLLHCCDDTTSTKPEEPNIRAALYIGRGADSDCITATRAMLRWADCTVVTIGASYINSEGLDGFDMVCIPGGDMYQYGQDLSTTGIQHIRDFVSGGGGYIGICGGAYFAAERIVWQGAEIVMTSLELFDGTAEGVLNEVVPYPDYGMCQVNIVDHEHPITQAVPDTAWILYYWGPALLPDTGSDATVLGMYERADKPALVALEYGDGRVFLTGPHPEFEEDGDRDGVSFADDLDDRGSDWDLMLRAIRWCLREEMPQ